MNRAHRYIVIILLLSGCVTHKTVGGYELYGKVIDSSSQKPLEGVLVSARYEAVSLYSNSTEVLASTVTGKDGRFKMSVPKTIKWGGTGGLSGYVSEWPSIHYTKQGYCKTGIILSEPSIEKYQNIEHGLKHKDGANCI